MADPVIYSLQKNLKLHIWNNWHGDVYKSGAVVSSGFAIPELADVLTYTDKNGVDRIFGPSLVSIGRYQDDPTSLAGNFAVPSSYVEIHAGNPYEPGTWQHELAAPDAGDFKNANSNMIYPYEIGAGIQYWRKFYINFTMFTIDSNQTQEENMRLGAAALSAMETLCTSKQVHNLSWAWDLKDQEGQQISDQFGETALYSYLIRSEGRQRGGPETSTSGDYIYDGKIWIQILTGRG